MRVGGIDREFICVEPRATIREFQQQVGLETLRRQITGKENRLLQTVVLCTGLDRECGCCQWDLSRYRLAARGTGPAAAFSSVG